MYLILQKGKSPEPYILSIPGFYILNIAGE